MAKRVVQGFERTSGNRVTGVEMHELPRHLQGYDPEYAEGTLTDSLWSRLTGGGPKRRRRGRR